MTGETTEDLEERVIASVSRYSMENRLQRDKPGSRQKSQRVFQQTTH